MTKYTITLYNGKTTAPISALSAEEAIACFRLMWNIKYGEEEVEVLEVHKKL